MVQITIDTRCVCVFMCLLLVDDLEGDLTECNSSGLKLPQWVLVRNDNNNNNKYLVSDYCNPPPTLPTLRLI